jgi:hypothetical protein
MRLYLTVFAAIQFGCNNAADFRSTSEPASQNAEVDVRTPVDDKTSINQNAATNIADEPVMVTGAFLYDCRPTVPAEDHFGCLVLDEEEKSVPGASSIRNLSVLTDNGTSRAVLTQPSTDSAFHFEFDWTYSENIIAITTPSAPSAKQTYIGKYSISRKLVLHHVDARSAKQLPLYALKNLQLPRVMQVSGPDLPTGAIMILEWADLDGNILGECHYAPTAESRLLGQTKCVKSPTGFSQVGPAALTMQAATVALRFVGNLSEFKGKVTAEILEQ